jgi:hypothetical protein
VVARPSVSPAPVAMYVDQTPADWMYRPPCASSQTLTGALLGVLPLSSAENPGCALQERPAGPTDTPPIQATRHQCAGAAIGAVSTLPRALLLAVLAG